MKKKNKWLGLINFIIDYAPIIVTVVAATIFSLWANFRAAKTEDAIQWILIILALLATTQLIDRFRVMHKLDEKVSGLVDAVGKGNGTTGLITDKVPDFTERIKRAKSIAMSGITLSRSSETYWSGLKRQFENGASVRIVLPDNQNRSLMTVLGKIFQVNREARYIQSQIERSLGFFSQIYAEIRSENRSVIRLSPTVPTFGMWLFDINTDQAEIWVEIYSFREPEIFPTLHLFPVQDEKWFKFFQQQYETLWNASIEWQPKIEPKK